MSMMQIAGVGILGTLLALQFKSQKSEYGIYVSVALSLMLFFSMGDHLGTIVDTLSVIGSFIRIDSGYITAMLKMLGVVYLAEFAVAICKDAGNQTIAGQIEVCAKLVVLALSMPVLKALLVTIQDFLQ